MLKPGAQSNVQIGDRLTEKWNPIHSGNDLTRAGIFRFEQAALKTSGIVEVISAFRDLAFPMQNIFFIIAPTNSKDGEEWAYSKENNQFYSFIWFFLLVYKHTCNIAINPRCRAAKIPW